MKTLFGFTVRWKKLSANDEALEQLLADAITKVNLKNEC